MTRGLQTFLTFQGGVATAALDLYRDVFDDFELLEIDRYGPVDAGPDGTGEAEPIELVKSMWTSSTLRSVSTRTVYSRCSGVGFGTSGSTIR